MKQKTAAWIEKCKPLLWPILYLPLYMIAFVLLEKRDDVSYYTIHCSLDDIIPFCEYFIIPYLLWFAYVVGAVLYLSRQTSHLEDYYRCIVALIAGMSICLVIYYILPNRQNLRPTEFAHQNLFTHMVQFLYASDTSTNVFPSIHVYNSLAVHTALATCHSLRRNRAAKVASGVLCVSICLSTMFLKQHSFMDVAAGILLYLCCFSFIYYTMPRLHFARHHRRKRVTL